MILRTFYAITNAYRYRAQLKQYIVDPKLQIENVTTLTSDALRARGAEALVLDFDGVLAAHGEAIPRPEVMSWLRALVTEFAPHQVLILSNKPTAARQEFFKQNLPTVGFIVAKRKKPYPDGMLEIMQITHLSPDKILLVDDRLGTGVLATLIVGAKGLWVTKPYTNLAARPITEAGFIILRAIEKALLSI